MSTLQEIKTKEAWDEYSSNISPTTLQIIYFKAEWATPCKQTTTVLETLAASYPVTQPLSTSWISIDAEEVIDVSDSFDVSAVPYLVLRRGTQVIESFSGCNASTIREAIEKNLTNDVKNELVTSSVAQSNKAEVNNTQSHFTTTQASVSGLDGPIGDIQKDSKEDLNVRLSKLVKAAPVMLFMKGTPSAPQCGFSRQIVALLRESAVKYGFFNILADDEVRQGLKEFADWPTYPQLWINGELVGGLDIVKEEIANDPNFLKPFSVDPNLTGQTNDISS